MPARPTRDYAADLTREITKWCTKLDEAMADARVLDDTGRRFWKNIEAYRKDCVTFEDQGDLVRSFECIVWGWSWLEIGHDIGAFSVPYLDDADRA